MRRVSQSNGTALLGIVGATFEQGGVEIVDIDPDGGAAQAGLKIGDVINSVDGKRVRSMPWPRHGFGESLTTFSNTDRLHVSESLLCLGAGSR